MRVFAIYLNNPKEDAWRALRERWPGRNYILDDRLAFVAPKDEIVLTSQIAAAMGMVPGLETWGVVMELSAFNGFNQNDLWEWLDKARSA